jgi:uncharacterized protein (DUF983 family)
VHINVVHFSLAGMLALGLAVWYGSRRSQAAARRVEDLDKAGRWLCPRCESAELQRLPANFTTKHPGYRCKACGLRMRRANSTILYAFLLVTTLVAAAGVALLVCTERPEKWVPDLLEPHKAITVGAIPVGLVYLLSQLSRPTPKLREEPLYEGASSGR